MQDPARCHNLMLCRFRSVTQRRSRDLLCWPAIVWLSMAMAGCGGQVRAVAPSIPAAQTSVAVAQHKVATPPHAALVKQALFRIEVLEGSRIISSGTGFLVSTEGHLLTAGHVVEPAKLSGRVIQVVPTGSELAPQEATFLKAQNSPDVGLLKLPKEAVTGLQPLALSEYVGFALGQQLCTFGFRQGERADTYLEGKVSQFQSDVVRYNATTTAGFSGAPVFLEEGDVVVGLHVQAQEVGHAEALSVELLHDFLKTEGLAQLVRRVPVAKNPEPGSLQACPVGLAGWRDHQRLSTFVGRKKELSEITTALRKGQRVGVTGIGGVGKTALVQEALWRLWESGDTQGGVLWLDVGTRAPYDIAQQIGRELCRSDLQGERDPHTLLQLLSRDLRARKTLVVLDNVATDEIEEELLRGLEGVRLIETRRATLRDESLTVKVTLSGLDREDCRQYFTNHAGLAPEQGAQQTQALNALCSRLSDHPLGVKLAAQLHRERGGALGEYLQWLRNSGIQSLRTGEHFSQDLTKTFEVSLGQLSAPQKQLYRVLGVFPPGTMYTTKAIAAASQRDGPEFEQDLQRLQRLGLANWDPKAQRYQQHDLLQEYANQLLTTSGSYHHANAGFIAYYEQVAKELRDLPEERWNERLQYDGKPMRVAAERVVQAFEKTPTDATARAAMNWARLLGEYAWKRQAKEAERWLTQGFKAAQRLKDWNGQSGTAGSVAILVQGFGRAKESIDWSRKGLRTAELAKNRRDQGKHWRNLGLAYFLLGDYHNAIGYLEQTLKISRALVDQRGEGADLGNLGIAYHSVGDYQKAIGYYELALKISRASDDRDGEGNHLGNLGVVYSSLGDYPKGIGYHEQALKISRVIGDRRGEGAALGNLGLAYYLLGEFQKAIGYYEQGLSIAHAIGDRRAEGTALGNLGNVNLNFGEFQKAIGYYEQALEIAHAIGDRSGESRNLGNLGNVYGSLGEHQKAIGYHEQALKIACAIHDRTNEGNHLGNLGNAYYELGEYQKAIGYYEQGLSIARTISDRRRQAEHCFNLGLARKALQNLPAAHEQWKLAAKLYDVMGLKDKAAVVRQTILENPIHEKAADRK